MSGDLATSVAVTGSGATALAVTGFSALWPVVAGLSLIMFGVMINRLVPKKEY